MTMETTVFGKWILAGEHAVLRGSPALVFPVVGKSLRLSYLEEGEGIHVEFSGDNGNELRLLFWGVIEKAIELTGQKRESIRGSFFIHNNIPVGAGLGASAALCVALGRWFHWKDLVPEASLQEFCRQLENLFHGESSGVDIAVALSGKGLHYERSGVRYSLEPKWQPLWYISYSGKRGVTSECIDKVKNLWKRDSTLGEIIDRDMREAVVMAEKALQRPTATEGFDELAEAINKARSCFEHWDLSGGQVAAHIEMLLHHGAYAVKPTGSGDGGYVLSLWRTPPPAEITGQLIALGKA